MVIHTCKNKISYQRHKKQNYAGRTCFNMSAAQVSEKSGMFTPNERNTVVPTWWTCKENGWVSLAPQVWKACTHLLAFYTRLSIHYHQIWGGGLGQKVLLEKGFSSVQKMSHCYKAKLRGKDILQYAWPMAWWRCESNWCKRR